MPFQIKAKLVGVDVALKRLANLRGPARRKATRKIVDKATQVTARQMKGLAPQESGLLRKALGRKVKAYRQSGVAVGIVGPRTGFKRLVVVAAGGGKRRRGRNANAISSFRNPVKYAHLVELGRRAVAVKAKRVLFGQGRFWGRRVAAAQGVHFMQRSLDAVSGSLTDIAAVVAEEAIEAAIKGA